MILRLSIIEMEIITISISIKLYFKTYYFFGSRIEVK